MFHVKHAKPKSRTADTLVRRPAWRRGRGFRARMFHVKHVHSREADWSRRAYCPIRQPQPASAPPVSVDVSRETSPPSWPADEPLALSPRRLAGTWARVFHVKHGSRAADRTADAAPDSGSADCGHLGWQHVSRETSLTPVRRRASVKPWPLTARMFHVKHVLTGAVAHPSQAAQALAREAKSRTRLRGPLAVTRPESMFHVKHLGARLRPAEARMARDWSGGTASRTMFHVKHRGPAKC